MAPDAHTRVTHTRIKKSPKIVSDAKRGELGPPRPYHRPSSMLRRCTWCQNESSRNAALSMRSV
jgi:hypothetical protein